MAIAFVIGQTGKNSGGGTFTTTGVDTTGATLLVCMATKYTGSGGTNDTNPALTDSKSNTWIALTSATSSVSADRILGWYCKNPTVGASHTFTLTQGSPGNPYAAFVMGSFSGTDTTTALDKQAQTNDTASSTSQSPTSFTPNVNNTVVIQMLGSDGCDALNNASINNSFTIAGQQGFLAGSYVTSMMAYKIQTTATAETPTWTLDIASGVGMITASFLAGSAVAQNSNYLMRRR